ncbi:hypothetical protein BBG47_08585 [Paenibacillus sp. KS1]|uniref:IPT/TIG domain-containing protein n=1 Tax=Paenibacillus sp. KS1 TaxID=1849249 RepID=UPI0008065F15|nr:IPT/TIG domain-containing protein [Paenibacillus sp. KS1]OBY79932.1 hypothetical protein BBG47_08585 [Paenibacillus sp. KS1]
MRKVKHILAIVLTLLIVTAQIPIQGAYAASDYVTMTRTINPASILVGEEAEVQLGIQGTPPVNVVKPNDVILVIDKSGSMGPDYGPNNGENKMKNAVDAAKGFVDLMDFKKHRVGVVDFSTKADSFELTSDPQAAKNYIDTIKANGSTATGDAIDKAIKLLENHRPDAQPVIVLMTDGAATVGGDGLDAYKYALKKAEQAKDAGIVFYTIALLSPKEDPITSAPNKLMMDMATTAHHHHFVLGSTGLSEIYSAIVKEIGLASAYDVTVTEVVDDAFEIVPGSYEHNIPKPQVNGNTLIWNFLELKTDKLQFTYKIKHKSDKGAGKFSVTNSKSIITYKDYTGAPRNYSPDKTVLEVKYPAPTITTVTPDKAKIAGGEKIKIAGEHFRPGLKVIIGGIEASDVSLVNDKEIDATVPVGKQGQTTLQVINDDRQAATAPFNYLADPEVSKIDPTSGPLAGGTKIMITGKYFLPGIKVKVGENYSPTVTYHSDVYLHAVTPAGVKPGLVNITIENPDGTQSELKDAFRYNEPPKLELKSVSPAEGITIGNETVTLEGQLFEKGTKVFFGDKEVEKVTYYSGEKLTIQTPVWAKEDAIDVKVVNPDGSESVLAQGFKYLLPPPPKAPSVSSITPKNGPMEGGTMVYIDGSDFVEGVKVLWGGIELPTTFIGKNRLSVRTPSWNAPESISIKITNPDLQFVEVPNAFTYDAPPEYPAPVVTAVNPNHGPMAEPTIIYVDGKDFQKGAKMFFVHNGKEIELSANYVNAGRMSARTPVVDFNGTVTIKVVNPDDKSGELADGFTYDAPPVYPDPVIQSITPNSGNKNGGVLVEIVGTDFQKGATVTFGTTTVKLAAFMSPTTVRAYVPAVTDAGSVDVTLTNPDGKSSTLPNGYTYEEFKPEITKVSPNHGPMSGDTIVYIDGMYLEKGLNVTFNNSPVNYTYVNSSRIYLRTPATTTPGKVEIVITNPSGASTNAEFTYDEPPALPSPTLRSVSPSSGALSGGTIIYIDGSNFVKGIKIVFDGVEYPADYVNSGRIKFRVPAAGAPGVVSFKVINPDGKESDTSLNFEYK